MQAVTSSRSKSKGSGALRSNNAGGGSTGRNVISNDAAYRKTLSFYGIPPTEEVSLDEFEMFGRDRLRLLQEIYNAKVSGLTGKDLSNTIANACEKYLPLRRHHPEDVRKDVASHFILRLAFCQKTHRTWFLNQEGALLRHRLRSGGADIPQFLVENGLGYRQLDPQEYDDHKLELEIVCQRLLLQGETLDAANFFAVPFSEALSLIRSRRTLVVNGQAFLHATQLIDIVGLHFRSMVSKMLSVTYKAHSHFHTDERIGPLLHKWSTNYLSQQSQFSGTTGKVSITNIDNYARDHFPLCMKHQHVALRRTHHAKHTSRMQYGLFLKAIGVSLEDSLAFWKQELTQRPDVDEKAFQSRYAYNIRHNYGQEGKRTEYSAYGCAKIIAGMPGANETHGCPFRWSKRDELLRDCRESGVAPHEIEQVLKLVDGHHYQLACKVLWDLTHPGGKYPQTGVTHPNEYFAESLKYAEAAGASKEAPKIAGQKRAAPNSAASAEATSFIKPPVVEDDGEADKRPKTDEEK